MHAPSRATTPAADGSQIRSNAYHAALLRLERFARDETATVLLLGESGTGKTTLAPRIHELSPRSRGPFQHITLSALDDGVVASDFFGHVAGAYTDARHPRAGVFASAKGGTLFLDEIGKASPGMQEKLLHAIEYHEIKPVGADRALKIDVRIVAATNIPLSELVAAGKFLPDLYARLRYFQVTIPPLRHRRADIPDLIARAIERHAPHAGYARPPRIEASLMVALRGAAWVDNLRGLDSFIHCLLLEANGAETLTLGHCVGELSEHVRPLRGKGTITDAQVAEALRTAGSLSAAARVLGIDRKTLRPIAHRLSGGESQASI